MLKQAAASFSLRKHPQSSQRIHRELTLVGTVATGGGITMKTLCLGVLPGMLSGCATAPSGHWEQAGRTEVETRDDLAHCEHVAFLESQRNKSDEPFKGPIIEKNCMQRMGYTYINNPK
jgi:hypothetical protein